jgi:hypothetical protein
MFLGKRCLGTKVLHVHTQIKEEWSHIVSVLLDRQSCSSLYETKKQAVNVYLFYMISYSASSFLLWISSSILFSSNGSSNAEA